MVERRVLDCTNFDDSKFHNLISQVMCYKLCVFRKTEHKQLNITCLFPEKYPNEPLVVELNSKTLAHKLLMGLTNVCEVETKKIVGQPQVSTLSGDPSYFEFEANSFHLHI